MTEIKEVPALETVALSTAFAALADPNRLIIVRELLNEPSGGRRKCSSFAVNLSRSTMTHHFRVLREAGLIIQHDYGNRAELELRRDDFEARFPRLLDLVLDA